MSAEELDPEQQPDCTPVDADRLEAFRLRSFAESKKMQNEAAKSAAKREVTWSSAGGKKAFEQWTDEQWKLLQEEKSKPIDATAPTATTQEADQ